MVASTFIISKPIVHIHAVDNGGDIDSLPMDWKVTGTIDANGWELAVKGNWQLTTFGNPTDPETIRDGESEAPIAYGVDNSLSPQSYIESRHNREIVANMDVSDWNTWRIYLDSRYDGNPKPIFSGDNESYMIINPAKPNNMTSNPAAVFTAPEDGTYTYSEFVEGVLFEKDGSPVSVTATVRKNGVLIDAFVPTSTNASRTLEGKVSLKKGELLMFVFTLNSEVALGAEEEVIHLGNTYVKKSGDYVEDASTGTKYVLPMDWSTGLTKDSYGWDLSQKGNWRLAGAFVSTGNPNNFVNAPSNITVEDATNTDGIGPAPWIESYDNRVNAKVSNVPAGYCEWDVNAERRDRSGTIFKYGDNGSFIRVSPRNLANANVSARYPSVIFTAPENGTYSYSTLVSGAAFKDSTGAAVEGMVTIRSNGNVVATFSPTPDDAEAILTGTVELVKGETFVITFHCYEYGDLGAYTHTFNIGDTSLTKIGKYNRAEVNHSPIFDGTSLTDISGNVKLWGYNTDTETFYDMTSGDIKMVLSEDGTTWYAHDLNGTNGGNGVDSGPPSKNYIWSGLVNGPITMVGGNLRTENTGFALIFTAPYEGTFTVNADLQSIFIYVEAWGGGSYHDHKIMLGDGTVLKEMSTRGQPNEYTVSMSVKVDLKKGDQVIILKTPDPDSDIHNNSCNGNAKIEIKEVNHVCQAGSLKLVDEISAGCLDGRSKHYACCCGLIYSDAEATQPIEDIADIAIKGDGHDTGDYIANQSKHWKHCSVCNTDVEVEAHTWAGGACKVCKYACDHSWNGDNVCDNCGYDRAADLAVESLKDALDNYFNEGANNEVNPVGPTTPLDSFKVTRPSEKVTGLEYAQFNLRFENGIILRHHFIVEQNIGLYTFTVNGVEVTPVNTGAKVYYIETVCEAGKLHVPDTITVKKGDESVDFSVSVYSYIAVALEKSTDPKVKTALKSLYDYNEALYTASGDRALLEITVESEAISKFKSDRTYDETKDDITLILVMGQSNFTTSAGFAWEYGFNYLSGQSTVPPVSPIVPNEGTVYSFFNADTKLEGFANQNFALNASHDMHYLSNPIRGTDCIGGVTPVFGTKWHELTGTKVVFLQVAEGSTGIDEWVPNPDPSTCGCSKGGKADRYAKAVAAYTNAYEALSKEYNVVLSGYIWNQGEADELEKSAPVLVRDDQSYYDAYTSMHNSIMSELDLDFGGISVVRADRAGDTKEASASYTKARAAQYKLCNDLENLYMISTFSETCSRDMMDQGNTVHYSQKVFNEMGVDMANNLYSQLGYGPTNAYAGIKILSKTGYTITDIDANGELVSGSNVITADSTAGRIIVKKSALGRDDTVSCKITVNGVDCSKYINGFGVIDWAALEAETGMTSLKVVVNVK